MLSKNSTNNIGSMTRVLSATSLKDKLPAKLVITKPNTTKLMLQRVEDWTDESFAEDVYGKPIDSFSSILSILSHT